MMRTVLLASLLLLPGISAAQTTTPPAADATPADNEDAVPPAPVTEAADGSVHGTPPQRIRSVLLRGSEPCPPSTNGEIIVCSTVDEPYRIPKRLRQLAPSAANRTWASRAEGLDDIGRSAAGLPNSCSPTGSGGQTGCTQQLIEQWRAEQRAKQQGQSVP